MLLRFAVLLAALCLCAASAPQPTYSVRRSALAPELAPSLRDGQPMSQRAEISLGSAGLAEAGGPQPGDVGDPGVEVPRYDVNGGLRLRLRKSFDVGFIWDQGLDDGAQQVAGDQPAVDGGDVMGGGVSLGFHGQVGEGVYISFNADLLRYSVPYAEYRTCVSECELVPDMEVYRGRRNQGVIGLGLLTSWKRGAWTLFGGVAMRNHPYVPKGGLEVGADDGDHELTGGPLVVMANAGASLDFGRGASLTAMAYQASTGPVAYAPALALGLTVPFGGDEPPRAP